MAHSSLKACLNLQTLHTVGKLISLATFLLHKSRLKNATLLYQNFLYEVSALNTVLPISSQGCILHPPQPQTFLFVQTSSINLLNICAANRDILYNVKFSFRSPKIFVLNCILLRILVSFREQKNIVEQMICLWGFLFHSAAN